MKKILNKSMVWAFGAISFILTLLPESWFEICHWPFLYRLVEYIGMADKLSSTAMDVVSNRIALSLLVMALAFVVFCIISKCRESITIEGSDYVIKVEYGDLLKISDAKRIISFDECYTTKVGYAPADINPSSLCGKYLLQNPELNVEQLIQDANLSKERSKSVYQRKDRYKSGTIVASGDDLLMAFAQLDESGRGMFPSLEEYQNCLFTLWNEIDKHYGQKDVCIPILGAGVTRIGDGYRFSQQELLNMIIRSYKLSVHKLKKPCKLRIICQRSNDFSLNKIEA